jgi:hypothetical protein
MPSGGLLSRVLQRRPMSGHAVPLRMDMALDALVGEYISILITR